MGKRITWFKQWRLLCIITIIIMLTPVLEICAATIEVIETYTLQEPLFIQGLQLETNDTLLVSIGQYGNSSIGRLSLSTGKYSAVQSLENHYFGEGLTFTDTGVWQLTWQENIAFKRDSDTLEVIEHVNFNKHGWGITYDDQKQEIWTSDGTNQLVKRDPITLQEKETISVVSQEGKPVYYLNELEFATGSIYANIWLTNTIVEIDSETGIVKNSWDFTQLIETMNLQNPTSDTVLNGIAHVESDIFYITGKLFPNFWKVRLHSE